MVYAFDSVVRHLAAIIVWTSVCLLVLTQVWRVDLAMKQWELAVSRMAMSIVKVNVRIVKYSSSVFDCVIVSAVLVIMLAPICQVFALFYLEFR